MSLALHAKTALRLGLSNIARVAVYRLGLRTGLHPVLRVQADIGGQRFFRALQGGKSEHITRPPASQRWRVDATFFGWRNMPLAGSTPDWHANPFHRTRVATPQKFWYEIPDFDSAVGDIKTIWEASRFEWLLPMAQRARLGDQGEIDRMNEWLADWCAHNPAYRGPNWKCGQEASIRVIHLAVAARLLGQDAEPEPDLLRLVYAHLLRVYPTISYAMGQDNNHGTSEAVGLFVGGHWCHASGIEEGLRWAEAGRKLLENRVRRLVEPDGSFSQYSVNYHRLMLDTLCVAELWRRWHGLEPFSQQFYERAKAAVNWLYAIVNAETGDAPNVGANDGARLLPLVDADYRDFRPSVQLAMALFQDQRAYTTPGLYDFHLAWLGVPVPERSARTPASSQFEHGGYAVLRRDRWFVLMRYPRFRFRPSQCDALHVDVWFEGDNLLRDGGTYSYNAEAVWQAYFPGTASHNTIQFDGREQMPRLGRFLWGAWLATDHIEPLRGDNESIIFGASYRDSKGARHSRRLRLDSRGLTVQDRIDGFSERAVLRWRLKPGDWEFQHKLDGNQHHVVVGCGLYTLEVRADVPLVRCELVQGWESRYYLQKTPLPVLEVEVRSPGTLTTEFTRREV